MNSKYEKFKESIDSSLNMATKYDDESSENTAFAIAVINDQKVNIRRYASKYRFDYQHSAVCEMIKGHLSKSNITNYDEDIIGKAITKIGIFKNWHLFLLIVLIYIINTTLMLKYSDVWLSGVLDADGLELVNISVVLLAFPYFLMWIRLSVAHIRFYRI